MTPARFTLTDPPPEWLPAWQPRQCSECLSISMVPRACPTSICPEITSELPASFMPPKKAWSWQARQRSRARLLPRNSPGSLPCAKWQVLQVSSAFQSSGYSAGRDRLGAKPLGWLSSTARLWQLTHNDSWEATNFDAWPRAASLPARWQAPQSIPLGCAFVPPAAAKSGGPAHSRAAPRPAMIHLHLQART